MVGQGASTPSLLGAVPRSPSKVGRLFSEVLSFGFPPGVSGSQSGLRTENSGGHDGGRGTGRKGGVERGREGSHEDRRSNEDGALET